MAQTIAQANGQKLLVKQGGNTQDIIEEILDAVTEVRGQTKGFARKFSRDRAGMRQLWQWVRSNIRYEEDPLGVQWVREPARLWHDRVGDCKSFTLFIVSVLENLNLRYFVRFSNTDDRGSRNVNHVYPVAVLPGGEEVILDAVWRTFDSEKAYFNAIDYTMADIYRLSGIGSAAVAQTEQYLTDVQALAAEIPDEVLDGDDITEMSAGQFRRWQASEQFLAQAGHAPSEASAARYVAAAEAVRTGSVAGLGNLAAGDLSKIRKFIAETSAEQQKAFPAPVLEVPDGVAGIGNLISNIANAVKEAWKKVVNWLFKSAMPGAAPFFLYTFIKKSVGKKTDAKRARQSGLLQWIQKAGKFDSANAVMNAARTGIVKHFGKQPEALLNEASSGKGTIAGHSVGAFAVVAAKVIMFIVEIVSKIAKLFKKKQPDVSQGDAPDYTELASEYAASIAPAAQGGGQPGPFVPAAQGGGNNNLLIIGGLGLAALLLTRK
jgi:hypothetical protein